MQFLCETHAKWAWKFYLSQATYGIYSTDYLNETRHPVLLLKSVIILSQVEFSLLVTFQ